MGLPITTTTESRCISLRLSNKTTNMPAKEKPQKPKQKKMDKADKPVKAEKPAAEKPAAPKKAAAPKKVAPAKKAATKAAPAKKPATQAGKVQKATKKKPLFKFPQKGKTGAGEVFFTIDKNRRVTVRPHSGKAWIDIREYFAGKDGKPLAAKRGISLSLTQLAEIKKILPAIEEAAKSAV